MSASSVADSQRAHPNSVLAGLKVYDSQPPDSATFQAKGTMARLQVVDITQLAQELDAATFYTHFGHEPVIVRGLYRNKTCLQNLTRSKIAAMMRGQKIFAWNRRTGAGDYVPSEAVFADLDQPQGNRLYNVVDHPVDVSTFGEPTDPPAFLQDNWFLDSTMNTDYYRLNITISAQNNWTALHVDNNGMQGWMWLAYGRKEWQLFSPDQAQLLFDPVFKMFYDERATTTTTAAAAAATAATDVTAVNAVATTEAHSINDNQPSKAEVKNSSAILPASSLIRPSGLNGTHTGSSSGSHRSMMDRSRGRWPHSHLAQGLEGVMEGGDLLWFPPGWAHQVFTPQESFGIGGCVINHFLVEEAAYSVILDRSNFFTSDLDVKKLIQVVAAQPDRLPSEHGARSQAMARVQAACDLFDQFEMRRQEIISGGSTY